MSNPNGSALSPVSGDGGHRPVEGNRGVNSGRPCDWARGDSSSSNSKGT